MRYCISCNRLFGLDFIQSILFFGKGFVCLECKKKGITSEQNATAINDEIKRRGLGEM